MNGILLMHDMEVVFPGGKRVDVLFKGFRVETDQKKPDGSPGAAPEPFDLFIASIGACSGIYALLFCQKRNLNVEGLKINLRRTIDSERRMTSRLELELVLPQDFPDKYRTAILNAVNLCSIKKHLDKPPEFDIYAQKPGEESERPLRK